MKKTPFDRSPNSEDELLPEYNFNYQKAKPNRFATQSGKRKMKVVVLEEDVAQVFTTPESVNKVLRALIETMPRTMDSETASDSR
ncbi:hypothetical protein [Microseira wollei]|uniref:Uncharacterized protein n=1 Tax=Microseira wollei NIES-4236 TaxID=2530354 RepID=A0AAV3XDE0_9CYAN|nr:hypothetical protein [Microseira wollei]GET37422.1 hypothetical protein MiSe_21750 [Microseira wollei NIES-4236]